MGAITSDRDAITHVFDRTWSPSTSHDLIAIKCWSRQALLLSNCSSTSDPQIQQQWCQSMKHQLVAWQWRCDTPVLSTTHHKLRNLSSDPHEPATVNALLSSWSSRTSKLQYTPSLSSTDFKISRNWNGETWVLFIPFGGIRNIQVIRGNLDPNRAEQQGGWPIPHFYREAARPG